MQKCACNDEDLFRTSVYDHGHFESTFSKYAFGRGGGGHTKEYAVYARENDDNYGRPLRQASIQYNTITKTQARCHVKKNVAMSYSFRVASSQQVNEYIGTPTRVSRITNVGLVMKANVIAQQQKKTQSSIFFKSRGKKGDNLMTEAA